jgi:hypothetical protein
MLTGSRGHQALKAQVKGESKPLNLVHLAVGVTHCSSKRGQWPGRAMIVIRARRHRPRPCRTRRASPKALCRADQMRPGRPTREVLALASPPALLLHTKPSFWTRLLPHTNPARLVCTLDPLYATSPAISSLIDPAHPDPESHADIHKPTRAISPRSQRLADNTPPRCAAPPNLHHLPPAPRRLDLRTPPSWRASTSTSFRSSVPFSGPRLGSTEATTRSPHNWALETHTFLRTTVVTRSFPYPGTGFGNLAFSTIDSRKG